MIAIYRTLDFLTFYCKGTECQVKKWREVLDNVYGERK